LVPVKTTAAAAGVATPIAAAAATAVKICRIKLPLLPPSLEIEDLSYRRELVFAGN
jgi:hypothetical protein